MELLNTKKYGGYDVHFLDTLSVNFECPVCRMAFREPIQTDCGHRLCLSCSEEIKIRNEGVLICPLDKSISDKTFSDKAYEREILQLKVKCGNFQNNCEWTGELKLLSVCFFFQIK
ncbi:TNF receptor-associated factor 6-A [Hydra vulgaris]|uniref:TNF receptor-associated factor 6-A n=1 Tax=Hydra vulgaris TaxID=6087 RepID=UPI0032E9D24F